MREPPLLQTGDCAELTSQNGGVAEFVECLQDKPGPRNAGARQFQTILSQTSKNLAAREEI
jgi:hypothetical protein